MEVLTIIRLYRNADAHDLYGNTSNDCCRDMCVNYIILRPKEVFIFLLMTGLPTCNLFV